MSRRQIVMGLCLGSLALLALPGALPRSGGESAAITADDAARPTPAATAQAAADLGWIGLTLQPAADGRPAVANVFPGGPAAFAGLQVGDVITDVNGHKVTSAETAANAIESLAPGRPAVIRALRGERALKLTATAGSLRDFHTRYVAEMLRRDPRHPQYAEHHGVSPADLQVELTRRTFEQNQRLEYAIQHLRNEVQQLRQELQSSKR